MMKTSSKSFIPEGNVPEWKRYFGLERTEVCLFELLQLIIFTIEIMLRKDVPHILLAHYLIIICCITMADYYRRYVVYIFCPKICFFIVSSFSSTCFILWIDTQSLECSSVILPFKYRFLFLFLTRVRLGVYCLSTKV